MRLRIARELEGHSLAATDGTIGRISDLYFDDQQWQVRYCVVDTGQGMNGRKVLIAPTVMGEFDPKLGFIPVELTVNQVRHSPDIDTDQPVSRRHEEDLQRHYGWPIYWDGAIGPNGVIAPAPPPLPEQPTPHTDQPLPARGDPHLRSCNDTIGHHVEAVDGAIGHVQDFLIEDRTWRIRYLVVDTRNWWPGKRVIIEPSWVLDVSWSQAQIAVDLTRDRIKGSPPYEANMEWTEEHAAELRRHYGRPEPHPQPSPHA